jgi:plastocyanin
MRAFLVSLFVLSLVTIAASSFAAVTQVTVGSFAFTPHNVTVAVGDTVKWVWLDGAHTATSGDTTSCTMNGIFNGPLDTLHPNFQFRFTSAGSFPYFCIPHCSLMHMHGLVTARTSDVPGLGLSDGRLLQAAPNPFQPETILSFRIDHAGPVRLEVFDASGRLVATLADGDFQAGQYSIPWDGRTLGGTEAPSGVYFARRTTAGSSVSAVLLRTR